MSSPTGNRPAEQGDTRTEVEDIGTNDSNINPPLTIGSSGGPIRLSIDGGRGFELRADKNGLLEALKLDDFGNIILDAPKAKGTDTQIKEYTLRQLSIFTCGTFWGCLSSAIQNDRDAYYHTRSAKKAVPSNATRYQPHVRVKDLKTRVRLAKITGYIEYLDRGFAEYFQAVGLSDNHEAVSKLLADARKSLEIRNPSSPSYTGELGKFCESVLAVWERTDEKTEWLEYRPRIRTDEDKIGYLQDALEIPYWDFMIKSFMDWRHSQPNHVGANGILYILNHITTICRKKIQKINEEIHELDSDEQAAVATVIGGVERRLELLDAVLLGTTVDPEDLDEASTREKQDIIQNSGLAADGNPVNKTRETSTLIALVFGFLILSTTFFCIGFAKSWKENQLGSLDDADFWYLCHSNVMSVLGSLATAIPLLRHHSFERARIIFWMTFVVSVITAVISIAIYVYFNTCYSALVAFLGSIASAASLLALTQATTPDTKLDKPKVGRNKLKQS